MRCAQTNRKKPEDALAERGFTFADVKAASDAGENLAAMERKFGISKHHVRKIAAGSTV